MDYLNNIMNILIIWHHKWNNKILFKYIIIMSLKMDCLNNIMNILIIWHHKWNNKIIFIVYNIIMFML